MSLASLLRCAVRAESRVALGVGYRANFIRQKT